MQSTAVIRTFILGAWIINISLAGVNAQETVFTGLQSPMKRAERYNNNQQYTKALELYLQAAAHKKPPKDLPLKVARTYIRLNKSAQAADWYQRYLDDHETLPAADLLAYAEVLTGLERYKEAISYYQWYRKQHPEDETIMEKIWSLTHISRLWEDSVYYSIKEVPFNSSFSEFAPAFVDKGLVFVSNNKPKGGVLQLDPTTNLPYLSLYYLPLETDTVTATINYGSTRILLKSSSKLHQGPAIQMPTDSSKLIFTRSSRDARDEINIQLFWAHRQRDKWVEGKTLSIHEHIRSASYPAISRDGKLLYFVSDSEGGFGGKDLYRSEWQHDRWAPPENLGAAINTPGDETTPFIHSANALYFASNGHAGMGGLDLFRAFLHQDEILDIVNLGYPINTSFDDFGLVLDQWGAHGFMASNRGKSGFNDDIYELEIDLQTYPLTISGKLLIRESTWADSISSQPLAGATMMLIDNYRKVTLSQIESSSSGEFILEIPYASQYKIRVIQSDIGSAVVSLEVPKNRKLHHDHQIVVVKSMFQSPVDEAGNNPDNLLNYKQK